MRASSLPNGKVSHASSTDRLQALGRSRRGVVLIVLAACTTCLLAAQAAAAWRRGPGGSLLRADGGSDDQRQLLHQLVRTALAPGVDAMFCCDMVWCCSAPCFRLQLHHGRVHLPPHAAR